MERSERVGLYSVAVNLSLASLKLGLAAISGSLALAADAIHSLVDVLGSVVVLAGVLIARRKSRSFPFGLYKVENLVSVALALLIFLAAYEIAREALLEPAHQLQNGPLALAGAALATLIAFLFSHYERRLGSDTGSPSLIADSEHFRSDVLSSAVVFLSVLGGVVGMPLDRVGAIAIVLFILHAGWSLFEEGMRVLLDASLDHRTLAAVRDVISADRTVAEIRSLVGRNSGRYKFIEAEVVLRVRDLEKAHQVSERIEAAVRMTIPRVDRVLIHFEPLRKEIRTWAIPLASAAGQVSLHFAQAPYFALLRTRSDSGQLLGREVLANPYLAVEKQKGIRVAEFLVQQGIDGLVVREGLEGKGPSYVLADAGVEVVLTQEETEEKALEVVMACLLPP